jgi:lactate permease
MAHPGSLILLVSVLSIVVFARTGTRLSGALRAATATWHSAASASLGIISMVGLSTLMDHCGMSYLLAEGLKNAFGTIYPVISPCVGILGAFATGSNNNSNVLFGSLQKNVALLLQVSPALLTAAQTAGGSLGSMLAPAKIVVGCSTVGQVGREGVVLRQTVPIGLLLGFILGLLSFILSRL